MFWDSEKVPVVIIAGSADRLLPSPEEAARLKKIIPGCRTMLLEGHGHAPLFDGRVDLSEIIASDPAMKGVEPGIIGRCGMFLVRQWIYTPRCYRILYSLFLAREWSSK